jgi:YD repeat-containing protein
MVTRYLLKEVLVKYKDTIIRKYEFKYLEGMFHKSLLEEIIQYGADGDNVFNSHKFKYHNKLADNYNSDKLQGFNSQTDWKNAKNITRRLYVRTNENIGTIGGSKSKGKSSHQYYGFAPGTSNTNKGASGGVKKGKSSSKTNALLMLMDIDGDGLPDQVYPSSNGISYKSNMFAEGKQEFSGNIKSIPNISKLSEDKNKSKTRGLQGHYGYASAVWDKSSGSVENKYYFSDVNGDGLVDYIKNGTVYFNSIKDGKQVFHITSPIPFGSGKGADASAINLDLPQRDELLKEYPREDPLRVWRAPYLSTGRIRITGKPVLFKKPAPEDEDEKYTTNDGVILSIEHKGNVLWSKRVEQSDIKDVSTEHDIVVENINPGEQIFFRVNSVYDGSFDEVKWDPEIKYIDSANNQYRESDVDENGFQQFRYQASSDFYINAENLGFISLDEGRVKISGTLNKKELTSDNLEISIFVKRKQAGSNEEIIVAEERRQVAGDFVGEDSSIFPIQFDVLAGDKIVCELSADTPIDFTMIDFKPVVEYPEALSELRDLKFKLPVSTKIFVGADAAPITPYVVDIKPEFAEGRISFGANLSYMTTPTGFITLPDGFNARVTVAVKKKNAVGAASLITKKSAVLDKNNNSLNINFNHTFTKGEEYYFVCSIESKEPQVMNYVVQRRPRIYYKHLQTTQNGNLGISAPLKEYVSRNISEIYAGGFRNWYYARYKGEYTGNSYTHKDWAPLDPDKMVAPGKNDSDEDKQKKMKQFCMMIPPVVQEMKSDAWSGNDSDCFITKDRISATREIEKYIMKEGETPLGGFGTASALPKYTVTSSNVISGSGPGVGAGKTKSYSDTALDFFDFNGDRFPDIVGRGNVSFTSPNGAQEQGFVGVANHGYIRSNESENINMGLSFSTSPSEMKTESDSEGKPTKMLPELSNLGLSVDISKGDTYTKKDYMDINGDGLPDQVSSDGSNTFVRYNLGYKLGAKEFLDDRNYFRHEKTTNQNGGGSAGFAYDKTGFGGGINCSFSETTTRKTYMDINGDGLPDKISRSVSISNDGVSMNGAELTVQFNTGSGFGSPYKWDNQSLPISYSKTKVDSPSVYFRVSIPIPPFAPVGWFIINPGWSRNKQAGRTSVQLQDIDGDGCVDHISSSDNGKVKAKLNKTQYTNLLQQVDNPLGGSFAIEYERAGNTQAMPQSRWVMSRVIVDDGMNAYDDSESIHTYTTEYLYKNGYYDRAERDFYGFEKVIERRTDQSTTQTTYNNKSFYKKGIALDTEFRDAGSKLYSATKQTVKILKIDERSYFPYVSEKSSYFYEGLTDNRENYGKSTRQTFKYDEHGNVTEFADEKDAGILDDVKAVITYEKDENIYVMNNPKTIKVYGGSGKLYRERTAGYDNLGNLISVSQKINGSEKTTTEINYYEDGNLKTITDSANSRGQEYQVTYTYDAETSTYVTSVTDSFGYTSTADYDLKFGVPNWTKDINGNQIKYVYDNFGRTREIYGPYDLSSTATIRMSYDINRFPAVAFTKNKVYWSGEETIDTVTYVDGLKRVEQVKKTSEVSKRKGMTVSGKVIYDKLGRAIKQGQPVFTSAHNSERIRCELLNPTITSYDVMGRKIKIIYPDERPEDIFVTMNYGFKEGKFLTKVTDQAGKVKMTLKNVQGNIVKVEEMLKGKPIPTTYQYNALNEIIKVTDVKGNQTKVTYDMLGRRLAIDNKDTGLTEYKYDSSGNVIEKITANLRAKGKSIKYVYDYNRLSKIDYPFSHDVEYKYGAPGASDNRAGRITKVANADFKEDKFYGKLGELTKSIKQIRVRTGEGFEVKLDDDDDDDDPSTPLRASDDDKDDDGDDDDDDDDDEPGFVWKKYVTQYEFDSVGRMKKLIYPDGEVLRYSYDAGGLLTKATGKLDGKSYDYLKDIEYDKFGQRRAVEYGNGVKTTYEYFDKTRRLRELKTTNPKGQILQNVVYDYDKVGNIEKIVNNGFVIRDKRTASRILTLIQAKSIMTILVISPESFKRTKYLTIGMTMIMI